MVRLLFIISLHIQASVNLDLKAEVECLKQELSVSDQTISKLRNNFDVIYIFCSTRQFSNLIFARLLILPVAICSQN